MPYSDGEALYRAILDNPADDVVRLVYADWLEESGTDAARAEFIRVQCELARLLDTQGLREAPCHENARIYTLNRRQRELLAANRRGWAHVVCPNCKGTGACDGGSVGLYACPECSASRKDYPGTGDAMQREGLRYEFRRGFVEVVKVPGLAWVMEFVPPKWGIVPLWRVTPWAIAIARTLPVTEFWIGGLEPYWDAGMWHFIGSDLLTGPDEPSYVPVSLHDEWCRHKTKAVETRGDVGREAALLALAQAAGRLVRRAAGYAE